MLTLMEEMKPVVLLKFGFEERERLKRFSLEFSDSQNFDEKEKTNDVLIEYSPKFSVCSNEILMVESELLLADYKIFEERSLSKGTALFLEFLDSHKSAAWNIGKIILTESLSARGMLWMKILVAEIMPVVTENYEFVLEINYQNWIFFEPSDNRKYDQRITDSGFSIPSSSTNVRLSFGTLMEETKLIVVVIEVFDYRTKPLYRALFIFLWLSGFWCKEQKRNSPKNSSPRVENIRLRPRLEI